MAETFQRILDVDRENQWRPIYAPFFAGLAESSFWSRLLRDGTARSSQSREDVLVRRVPRLRALAVEFLKAHFSHIRLYHACRIENEASYLQRGLLLADTRELQSLARNLFGDTPALTAAIQDLDASGYRMHNHGRVYLFFARSGAEHIGRHYRSGGSEYLQALAQRIGSGAKGLLSARGRPAYVHCLLPLDQLEENILRYAAMLPIRQYLTVRDPDAPPHFYAVEGGFAHSKPIPPEWIEIEYAVE